MCITNLFIFLSNLYFNWQIKQALAQYMFLFPNGCGFDLMYVTLGLQQQS